MQLIPRFVTVFTLVSALAVSGCSNFSPEGNAGIAAGIVGAATGIALGCAGVKPEITIPVALGAAALVGGATYFIAKNQATAHQKAVAKERAQQYYASLNSEQKSKLTRHLAVQTSKTSTTKGDPVMLYDTKTGEVEDYVWDFKAAPPVGKPTKIESTDATYVALEQ